MRTLEEFSHSLYSLSLNSWVREHSIKITLLYCKQFLTQILQLIEGCNIVNHKMNPTFSLIGCFHFRVHQQIH